MPRKPKAKPSTVKTQRGVGLSEIDRARIEEIRATLPEGTSFDATIRHAIKVCRDLLDR